MKVVIPGGSGQVGRVLGRSLSAAGHEIVVLSRGSTSPKPGNEPNLPQREFMATLRRASGTRIGLPATKWMVEIGAFFLRTDSELTCQSRRVVPGRLAAAGFSFTFPRWQDAAEDLVTRWRKGA